MPFKSEAQRRFMWLKHPRIAKRWANEPGAKNKGLPYHKKEAESEKKASFEAGFFDELNKLIAQIEQ